MGCRGDGVGTSSCSTTVLYTLPLTTLPVPGGPSCIPDILLFCFMLIQERASKQLPGPGQHFAFGAVRPWEEILGMLDGYPSKWLELC